MVDNADEPDLDELIGRAVGKYEIVRLLGKGGMGRVYEAINPAIGKRVVIKMLHPDVAKNREAVARFHREAQAASAAESPHIVEIFDSGFAEDGAPFIVMELLRGETLASLLKREGRISADETSRIVLQILRGLLRAHEAGITHRDLKPDNIFLVDRDPEPPFAKILDFGISKIDRTQTTTTLTREGTILGTPAYMSPEQAQGLTDVDARSDLWAVGAILYECLSGKPPFSGATYEQIIVRICTMDPEPIGERVQGLPAHLEEAVTVCLRRERSERFAAASELLTLLGEQQSLPRVVRPFSVSPTAMTPTLEAQAVQARLRESKPAARSRVVPLAIFGLSGAVALAAFLATTRDEDTPSSSRSATPFETDSTSASAEPSPSTSITVDVPSDRPEASAILDASDASSSVGRDASARTAKKPSPVTPATSAPVVEASAPPTATVQPTTPKGVAGDLQIQRK